MTSKNRYPGPKPFRTDEKDIFFGRETDIAEFYKYIFLHQSVVLFGKSGYGKSSLINAGIIPLLAEKNKQVHYFEVKFGPYIADSDRFSPIERVKAVIKEKSSEKSSLVLEKYFQTDGSFWHKLKNYQISHEANEIIFFFDQFEELFTYPEDLILEFKQQLADVLYTTVPTFFRNQEDLLDEEDVSEEFRLNFYQKPEIKVVFAIRSDRLGQLEELKDYHPTILKDCYELKGLDKQGALAAVLEPATIPDEPKGTFKTAAFEIQQDLAEKLVAELQDKNGRVETSTLQIICWQVEDKFVQNWIQEDEKFVLTLEHIDIDGDGEIKDDIESVFNNYYKDTIENNIYPQFKDATYRLVEEVMVQNGQRIPFEYNYLTSVIMVEQLGVPDRKVARKILDILREASLLKVEQDSQKRFMYELGHDTLVEPISKAAKIREEREEQIRAWEEAEKAREEALKSQAEKEKADEQAKIAQELTEVAQTERQKADEQAAKFLVMKRKAEIRSMIAAGFFALAVVAGFFAIYVAWKAREDRNNLYKSIVVMRKVLESIPTNDSVSDNDSTSAEKTTAQADSMKSNSKSTYKGLLSLLNKIIHFTDTTKIVSSDTTKIYNQIVQEGNRLIDKNAEEIHLIENDNGKPTSIKIKPIPFDSSLIKGLDEKKQRKRPILNRIKNKLE